MGDALNVLMWSLGATFSTSEALAACRGRSGRLTSLGRLLQVDGELSAVRAQLADISASGWAGGLKLVELSPDHFTIRRMSAPF